MKLYILKRASRETAKKSFAFLSEFDFTNFNVFIDDVDNLTIIKN